jgi:hypothetical protein
VSAPQKTSWSSTQRFVLLCLIVALGVVGYAVYSRSPAPPLPDTTSLPPLDLNRLAAMRREPHLLFRITSAGPAYGRVGVVSLSAPAAPPLLTDLSCDRVYASAQYGLCLEADRGVLTTYRAIAFDAQITRLHDFPLQGAPSRTRVAAAAPMGTSTVFVSGDSYASGSFSTRTTLYDLQTKAALGDLESFTVLRDGQPFKKQDFNFWGVTFKPDGKEFYATLGTGRELLLVEGSVQDRKMTIIGSDVECPMLSPDGMRLAFKKRTTEGGRFMWRLRVLDLKSRITTDLAETRNVDDQAEWLDNERVLYGLQRVGTASSDVWAVKADGTGAPEIFVPDAFSPAVVRVR